MRGKMACRLLRATPWRISSSCCSLSPTTKGWKFGEAVFDAVRRELTHRFGAVTAYMRSPAAGLWKKDSGEVDRDELAGAFGQQSLVCRAIAIEVL
jgi:hypothetical protein